MATRPKTTVLTALNRSVKNSPAVQDREDDAAVELARKYARALDNDEDLTKVGPKFLDVLENLLLTPKARDAMRFRGGGRDGWTQPEPEPEPEPKPDPGVDELEAVRAQRRRVTPGAD